MRLIESGDFTYVNFFRYILPIIMERRKGRILDIGSGAGTLSLFLAHLGFTVVGIDISAEAVEASKRSAQTLALDNHVKFFHTDFMEYASDARFDIIMCLEVIEHCREDAQVLRKAHDLMDEEGLLVLSSPLVTAPLAKMGMTGRFDAAVGHLRRYTAEQLIAKIRDSGFTVDRVTLNEGIVRNSFFLFPKLNSLVRVIRGGVLSRILTVIDDFSGKLFGYSDVIVIARRR
jgi:SAM-dependent methyltransferase